METFRKINRPARTEYPAYSQHYFDLIAKDCNILSELHDNFYELKALVLSLTEEQLAYRYAADKWTIKEILVHNIDDERIYTYRALRYARNDNTALQGFEEKSYAQFSMANTRTVESILDEYWAVRQSTIQLFQNLPEASFQRKGTLLDESGALVNERTVRALIYHIAGHELHHLKIIREKYLS